MNAPMQSKILNKPKKRSNSKKKMASYQERARRGMKGMILKWTDSDPFSENGLISETDVTHTNPTQRLIVRDMWARCNEWILNSEFTYLVQMIVVFETEKRGLKIDELEFNYTCTLRGAKSGILNDAMEAELAECLKCNNAIPDGHKNKGIYVHCEFTATITGV
jgi:hypothetical protein